MLVLTIVVAVLLFGGLFPWLMGRLDRFTAECARAREGQAVPPETFSDRKSA